MTTPDADPFGGIKEEKKPVSASPQEVNRFHSRSDVDSSQVAQHHTIGIKHDQASAGDHNHDGRASKKTGSGLNLAVSGSRGGNAALASLLTMLANVIDFDNNTTA